MAQTEKRGSTYRARYYDPLGPRHSKTFSRKADAERYLRESSAVTGSTHVAPRRHCRSGPRSSSLLLGDSPRRRNGPIAAT